MASDLKTEKLGKKLLSRFTRQLTDQVFLFLQQDPELYQEYQALVRKSSSNGVNSVLGRMITEAYDLVNLNKETHPPVPAAEKVTRHAIRWEKEDLEVQKKVLYGDRTCSLPIPDPARRKRPSERKDRTRKVFFRKNTPVKEKSLTGFSLYSTIAPGDIHAG